MGRDKQERASGEDQRDARPPPDAGAAFRSDEGEEEVSEESAEGSGKGEGEEGMSDEGWSCCRGRGEEGGQSERGGGFVDHDCEEDYEVEGGVAVDWGGGGRGRGEGRGTERDAVGDGVDEETGDGREGGRGGGMGFVGRARMRRAVG